MARKVLINAANLHVGGGVQVAISFIYEMTQLPGRDFSNINVIASTSVNEGLVHLKVDTSIFQSYRVIDLKGMRAFFSPLNWEIKKYDVVFTVFGPNYLRAGAKTEIVGFAQLWMLEFENALTKKMSFLSKSKIKINHLIRWCFYNRCKLFIVELEHVKNKLVSVRGIDPSRIFVVYNTVSSLYFDKSLWVNAPLSKADACLHLGIISRDYSHKNLSVLPRLAESLLSKHGLHVRFYVTFNDLEWEARDYEFKKHVTNAGALQPCECPSFYQKMDGVIFPSLLECFSVTPLEAMVMNKPLFASDRGFVRDVCGNYAFYFDPLDIENMSAVIADYFINKSERYTHLTEAKQHAASFSNAQERAKKYLTIIEQL